jgi:hypothetical protein
MSLEAAGEFLLEMHGDADATDRADGAYLEAVRAIAAERGYDVTHDELRVAMRAIAGLDDNETEGFAARSIGRAGIPQQLANPGQFDTIYAGRFDTVYGGLHSDLLPRFSPLGFMR